MEQTKHISEEIREQVGRLGEKIQKACERAGRRPSEVVCVAVAKGHQSPLIRAAVAAGIADIGENRVQEAQTKSSELSGLPIRWHLVGTLQTNKVRAAVRLFGMIQSLDRIDLARAVQTECEKQNRMMEALIQVEATGEPAKHGLKPEDVPAAAKLLRGMKNIRIRGLMAIGPVTQDLQKIRACFSAVHRLFRSLKDSGDFGQTFDTLSMGMSDDFESAILEGATMVRIGTLIFGPRKTP